MAISDYLKEAASMLRRAASALGDQNTLLSKDVEKYKSLTDKQIAAISATVNLEEKQESHVEDSAQAHALQLQERMLRRQIHSKKDERDAQEKRIKKITTQNEQKASKYESIAKELESDASDMS